MNERANQSDLVSWLREASPYVHAHRGQICVVYLSGAAVAGPNLEHHVYDLALLVGLGLKVVLVHGIRPQLEERLARVGVDSRVVRGIRITDAEVLPHVIDACGTVRARIEARLSQGVLNSPMSGAKLSVAGGNYVTARPVGVLHGVDYAFTGEVRRVDAAAARRRLDDGELLLLSPLAFSPSGESFNLDASALATDVAIALAAPKLVFVSESGPIRLDEGELVHEVTGRDGRDLLERSSGPSRQLLERALRACQQGVGRVHVVDHATDGALLLELFSRDGVGSLISATPFDRMRRATPDDVSGIIALIAPLETEGTLVRRSRDLIEREIDRFFVVTRDEAVVGCAALHPFPEAEVAELSCIAVDPQYGARGFGSALLRQLETTARSGGARSVFVLTTRAADWFKQQGFVATTVEALPVTRKQIYNQQRNSQVLTKALG